MKPIYLTVLSPKAVACQVELEGIASCLGPSAVALTLPLNATKWNFAGEISPQGQSDREIEKEG